MNAPLGERRVTWPKRWRWTLLLAGAALAVAAAGAATALERRRVEAQWTRFPPDQLASDATLFRAAVQDGGQVFERRCATCHGVNLTGDRGHNTPDLTDRYWLYDSGALSEIERTVLYGIRSGHPKAHNVTDMPSYWGVRALSRGQTADVVAYVMSLNGQSTDPATVERGRSVFTYAGVCYDCHGTDASGSPDFGAPDLHAGRWLYGGDRESLTQSVAYGRHGQCPAWVAVLAPAQIRSVAAFVFARSHPPSS